MHFTLIIMTVLLSIIANACTSIGAITDIADFLNDSSDTELPVTIDYNILYITVLGVVTLGIVQCIMFLQAFLTARLQSTRKIKVVVVAKAAATSSPSALQQLQNAGLSTTEDAELEFNRHNEEHEHLESLQQTTLEEQWVNAPNFGNVVSSSWLCCRVVLCLFFTKLV